MIISPCPLVVVSRGAEAGVKTGKSLEAQAIRIGDSTARNSSSMKKVVPASCTTNVSVVTTLRHPLPCSCVRRLLKLLLANDFIENRIDSTYVGQQS